MGNHTADIDGPCLEQVDHVLLIHEELVLGCKLAGRESTETAWLHQLLPLCILQLLRQVTSQAPLVAPQPLQQLLPLIAISVVDAGSIEDPLYVAHLNRQ